ncbi:unnamed protein product [Hymenolepis diminuta]|uniref:Uncharacterized protein n=1 Tax=Hymenolepis diminuta TaxID=6216 RepID=A0A0R3SC13_HYMDI|nr:unnamed protein product [Hymenolepis diminuta]VUZ40773.1 unnamed protein product [Hymenolepis diminuta]
MDSLKDAPSSSSVNYSPKSEITFHPSNTLIARRCKYANEGASKQLSLNMEKLNLEQQKACQRVEREQDQLCQQILDNTEHLLDITGPPNARRRIQRSKTMDIRSVYAPQRTPPTTKGVGFAFDEGSHNVRRTMSFKTSVVSNASSASISSNRSNSSVKIDQIKKLTQEESQPEWQVALAAKRREKLHQLHMFRELGHWGEDGCQTATAMLAGNSFNAALSNSSALSNSTAQCNENQDKNSK